MSEEEIDKRKAVKSILAGVNALDSDVVAILYPALMQLAEFKMRSGSFPGSRLRSKLKVLELACSAAKIASKTYGEEERP